MTTLKELHTIFQETARDFAKTREEVDELECRSRSVVARLIEEAKGFRPEKTALKETNPLYAVFRKMQETVHAQIEKWDHSVSAFEKNTQFRQRHGDSLLIYVYGQVKSGKSSLGNFLVYGSHNPTPECIAAQPGVEVFFEDDSGGKNITEEEFRRTKKLKIDYVEATSAIQGLTLSGLTWVDSPGIHSGTPENGKLAAEYLNSADFVIVTTGGRSACKNSEVAEIREIEKTRKPFLVVVTRCDSTEEDEDADGKIVRTLKVWPDKDREEMRGWCIDEIHRACGIDKKALENDVITISCRFAEENRDADGWERSGMSALARRVADVAGRDGVRHKKLAPLLNLRDYNVKVLESLAPLREEIDRSIDGIAAFRRTVEDGVKSCRYDLKVNLKGLVSESLSAHTRDVEALKKDLEERLAPLLKNAFMTLANDVHKAGESMTRGVASLPGMNGLTFPPVEDIYETITYETHGYQRGGSIVGALFGGVAGFLLAGPAGALIGASLGGMSGGGLGSLADGTSSEKRRVGDNRNEVTLQIVNSLEKPLDEWLDRTRKTLVESCVSDVEAWLRGMQKLLETARENFEEQNVRIDSMKGA